MPSFRTGQVTEILSERQGLQRVLVDLGREAPERTYVLTSLTGAVAPGERVVVNTTAVELGLGTGGWHVVHWNLAREELEQPGRGHVMKLRYTSLQFDAGAAEEDEPLSAGGDIAELPVAVCGLHSQMAVVSATFRHLRPGARLVYVMTDGAALPLAMSDLVDRLCERGVLDATITAGNAFGGDLEAVSVPSALALAAARLHADAVVVAMGPGITGTGTRLGTSGVEVASVLDLVAALGGRPIIALRASSADPRDRHRGVSHHSLTALELCRTPVVAPVPEHLGVPAPHQVEVVAVPDVKRVLESLDLEVTTMGRGPSQDPLFFDTAAAAGVVLARWAGRVQQPGSQKIR